MNHTTLVLLGVVLVAATLVISTLGVAPALAGGGHDKRDKYDKKGDSSATVTKQANKQKGVLSGFVTFDEQDADNCIAVLNDANACREQGQQVTPPGPPPPEKEGCPTGTVFDVTLQAALPTTGTPVLQQGDELCLEKQGENKDITVVRGGNVVEGLTPDVVVTPTGPDNQCDATKQQVRAFLSSGEFPREGNLGPTFVCVNIN
jgi:hypothetical protein